MLTDISKNGAKGFFSNLSRKACEKHQSSTDLLFGHHYTCFELSHNKFCREVI